MGPGARRRPGSTVAIRSSAASSAVIASVRSHQRASASAAPSRAVESASTSIRAASRALRRQLGEQRARRPARRCGRGSRRPGRRPRRRAAGSRRRAPPRRRGRSRGRRRRRARRRRAPRRGWSASATASATVARQRVAGPLHAGDVEALLVAEVVVEQRLGDPDRGGDLVHRHRRVAALGEERVRGDRASAPCGRPARAVDRVCCSHRCRRYPTINLYARNVTRSQIGVARVATKGFRHRRWTGLIRRVSCLARALGSVIRGTGRDGSWRTGSAAAGNEEAASKGRVYDTTCATACAPVIACPPSPLRADHRPARARPPSSAPLRGSAAIACDAHRPTRERLPLQPGARALRIRSTSGEGRWCGRTVAQRGSATVLTLPVVEGHFTDPPRPRRIRHPSLPAGTTVLVAGSDRGRGGAKVKGPITGAGRRRQQLRRPPGRREVTPRR